MNDLKLDGSKGITLIELLVTVAVLTIVLTVAVPSFLAVIENTKEKTTINNLTAAINLARSEAIKQRAEVVICVKDNSGSECSDSQNWNDGYIILSENGLIRSVDGSALAIEAGFSGLTFQRSGVLKESRSCFGIKEKAVWVSKVGAVSIANEACI